MEINPVGAALTHADNQADMTKLIGAFCDYVNEPKTSNFGLSWSDSLIIGLISKPHKPFIENNLET
jgi:hypothetical protein